MKLSEVFSETRRKRTASCTSYYSAVEHIATGYCRHQGRTGSKSNCTQPRKRDLSRATNLEDTTSGSRMQHTTENWERTLKTITKSILLFQRITDHCQRQDNRRCSYIVIITFPTRQRFPNRAHISTILHMPLSLRLEMLTLRRTANKQQ